MIFLQMKLTKEFLEYTRYQSVATNTKVFFGNHLPDIFIDPSVLNSATHGAVDQLQQKKVTWQFLQRFWKIRETSFVHAETLDDQKVSCMCSDFGRSESVFCMCWDFGKSESIFCMCRDFGRLENGFSLTVLACFCSGWSRPVAAEDGNMITYTKTLESQKMSLAGKSENVFGPVVLTSTTESEMVCLVQRV